MFFSAGTSRRTAHLASAGGGRQTQGGGEAHPMGPLMPFWPPGPWGPIGPVGLRRGMMGQRLPRRGCCSPTEHTSANTLKEHASPPKREHNTPVTKDHTTPIKKHQEVHAHHSSKRGGGGSPHGTHGTLGALDRVARLPAGTHRAGVALEPLRASLARHAR